MGYLIVKLILITFIFLKNTAMNEMYKNLKSMSCEILKTFAYIVDQPTFVSVET